MPRVNPVSDREAGPELTEIYRITTAATGRVSNFYRTVAHRPDIVRDLVTFGLHFLQGGEQAKVDLQTKWRLFLRTSVRNACHY